MIYNVKPKIDFNIGVVLFSLILVLLLKPKISSPFDEIVNIGLSSIVCVNLIIFFNTNLKIFKSWVRYDLFFLLGFLILHFQIPFLAAIGIEPQRPNFIWINKMVVNYATWLSAISMLMWQLGFLIYLRGKKHLTLSELFTKNVKYNINYKLLDAFLVILFCLFLIVVGNNFLGGSYDVNSWGVGATYVYMLLKIFIFLRIIYFYVDLNHKHNFFRVIWENKVGVLIVFLYSFLFLISGDRGPVLQIVSINLVAYSLFYKNIKGHVLLFFLFSGAVLFGILKEGRTRNVNDRKGGVFTEGYEAYSKQQFNPTDEFASSVRILYRALDVVPNQHPYLYGATLISNTVDVIPFSSTFY